MSTWLVGEGRAVVRDRLHRRVDAVHLCREQPRNRRHHRLVRLGARVQSLRLRRVAVQVEEQGRVVPHFRAELARAVRGATGLVNRLPVLPAHAIELAVDGSSLARVRVKEGDVTLQFIKGEFPYLAR